MVKAIQIIVSMAPYVPNPENYIGENLSLDDMARIDMEDALEDLVIRALEDGKFTATHLIVEKEDE